jgi:hypothetical protein
MERAMMGRPTVMMPLVKLEKKLIAEGWKTVRTWVRVELGFAAREADSESGSLWLEASGDGRSGGARSLRWESVVVGGWSSMASVVRVVVDMVLLRGRGEERRYEGGK